MRSHSSHTHTQQRQQQLLYVCVCTRGLRVLRSLNNTNFFSPSAPRNMFAPCSNLRLRGFSSCASCTNPIAALCVRVYVFRTNSDDNVRQSDDDDVRPQSVHRKNPHHTRTHTHTHTNITKYPTNVYRVQIRPIRTVESPSYVHVHLHISDPTATCVCLCVCLSVCVPSLHRNPFGRVEEEMGCGGRHHMVQSPDRLVRFSLRIGLRQLKRLVLVVVMVCAHRVCVREFSQSMATKSRRVCLCICICFCICECVCVLCEHDTNRIRPSRNVVATTSRSVTRTNVISISVYNGVAMYYGPPPAPCAPPHSYAERAVQRERCVCVCVHAVHSVGESKVHGRNTQHTTNDSHGVHNIHTYLSNISTSIHQIAKHTRTHFGIIAARHLRVCASVRL